ncbi:putative 4-hydroxy-4-methyl-2-oxoglutarate aldolase 3, partial [Bienertia sinuspersici]
MPTETTDVCDANSTLLLTGELRVLNHQIFKSYGGCPAFSGHVVTVKSFEDNAAVAQAVFANKNHDPNVLVVDAGGSLRRSMVGSILAQIAHNMGWVGILVNGCIRDIDQINAIDIGVRALGTVPVRSSKKGGGEKHVTDGDWVCADSNGILVSNCELSVLGPTYRPIPIHENATEILCGFSYTHTIADYTSPVEVWRLFEAHYLDDHNFLPKFLPHLFDSVEFVVGDSTAVGSIKLLKLSKDVNNHYIKYTTIEGGLLEDKWDHIVYEIKIEPSITGSHFKMIGHYHAKRGVKPTEEDVQFGRDALKDMHKAVQETLLLYPHLYA